MSSLAYYLVSLAASLGVIAAVSGLIARHLKRAQRQAQAVALLDALARSTDWVAAQGGAVCFQSPAQPCDPAMAEIAALQRQWFPELDALAGELSAVHRRLSDLLRIHERLRLTDPDAWLDGAHDAAFMTWRREHGAIVEAMEGRLVIVARQGGTPRQHGLIA